MSLPTMQKASLDDGIIDTHGQISKQTVELHGVSATRVTFQPGARWSKDMSAHPGTATCQLPHVSLVLSGTFAVVMDDGTEEYFSKNDVMLLPPGYDGRCIGNEPAVFVAFSRGNDYYNDRLH